MPKSSLPSLPYYFFPVLNTLLFVICNVIIYIYSKYIFLIGIASVHGTENTGIVQLADDFTLDYFPRPNYLFMFRFIDSSC